MAELIGVEELEASKNRLQVMMDLEPEQQNLWPKLGITPDEEILTVWQPGSAFPHVCAAVVTGNVGEIMSMLQSAIMGGFAHGVITARMYGVVSGEELPE